MPNKFQLHFRFGSYLCPRNIRKQYSDIYYGDKFNNQNQIDMKKIMFIIATALAGMFMLQSCDEVKIKESQLPDAAQSFIHQYFPGIGLAFAEMEKDDRVTHYNVRLADGTEIDFDADGNWTSVDCEYSILPEGILPAKIAEYITANYPNAKAYKIEKEFGGYEVGISGNPELLFDSEGEFLRTSR